MSNFIGIRLILKTVMGCHENHAFSQGAYQIFFHDNFVSHSGGPNEQFGTHEKLSWGQGYLNWMPGYLFIHGKSKPVDMF